MDDRREELAALHALRALDEDERTAFEIEMARDTGLEKLATELEQTAAALAYAAAPVEPPAHVKASIMERVKEHAAARHRAAAAPARQPSASPRGIWGWGIAALFALGCFWLSNERAQLSRQITTMNEVDLKAREDVRVAVDERDAAEKKNADLMATLARLSAEVEGLKKRDLTSQAQLAQLNSEVERLRKRDARSQMQIATLQSSVEAYKQGVAVVVWDSEKQTGVLKLEKMPPVDTGKDYQLWVVDPKNPTPVNAGIVKVDAQGFARVDFRPFNPISEASKFALSVEKEGGVPKGEGPIILIGP